MVAARPSVSECGNHRALERSGPDTSVHLAHLVAQALPHDRGVPALDTGRRGDRERLRAVHEYAGTSITPPVPAMRAAHASVTRVAARIVASAPLSCARTAATCSSTPVVPSVPTALTVSW